MFQNLRTSNRSIYIFIILSILALILSISSVYGTSNPYDENPYYLKAAAYGFIYEFTTTKPMFYNTDLMLYAAADSDIVVYRDGVLNGSNPIVNAAAYLDGFTILDSNYDVLTNTGDVFYTAPSPIPPPTLFYSPHALDILQFYNDKEIDEGVYKIQYQIGTVQYTDFIYGPGTIYPDDPSMFNFYHSLHEDDTSSIMVIGGHSGHLDYLGNVMNIIDDEYYTMPWNDLPDINFNKHFEFHVNDVSVYSVELLGDITSYSTLSPEFEISFKNQLILSNTRLFVTEFDVASFQNVWFIDLQGDFTSTQDYGSSDIEKSFGVIKDFNQSPIDVDNPLDGYRYSFTWQMPLNYDVAKSVYIDADGMNEKTFTITITESQDAINFEKPVDYDDWNFLDKIEFNIDKFNHSIQGILSKIPELTGNLLALFGSLFSWIDLRTGILMALGVTVAIITAVK